MADWFSENAPQQANAPPSPSGSPQSTGGGKDWFASNAPSTPLPAKAETPGLFGTLANDISSIPHAISDAYHTIAPYPEDGNIRSDAFHQLADPNLNLIKQGVHETSQPGQWLAGPTHIAEGLIPGVGPMTHSIATDIDAGNYGSASARALELAAPRIVSPLVRPMSGAASAVADPEFIESVPGGKTVQGMKTAFGNAYRRANATAIPETPFSVANDPRPMNGPERPPVPVLRTPQSPAWASHPAPTSTRPPAVEPVQGAALPSGRVGPAPVSRINPPPAPSLPPRTPMWQRAGTDVSPAPPNAPVEPIYPSGILPSGRTFGPNLGRDLRSPSPSSTAPEEARARSTLTPASPPMPVTPAGVARIGTTPAERITALSQSDEGTLGTRAEMMRQLRLADQAGASNSAKQDIIRRFERPEYTPRQFDPRESEIIAPSLTVPESPASTVNPPSSEPPTFANGGIKNNVRRK